MADDTNEDSWLYGTSNPDSTTNEEDRGEPDTQDGSADSPTDGTAANDDTVPSGAAARNGNEADSAENEGDQSPDTNEHEHKEQETADDPANEMEEQDEEGEIVDRDGGDSDLDDSDDDINVVIGDIKSGPTTATTYNIKQRANLIAPTAVIAQEKPKPSAGKFSIEEFESVGTINGVPAHEFSIDSLDEKPWRKPGADITDYFNYGFNEETWRSYCERQKRFRIGESGVGLQGLAAGGPNIITQSMPNNRTLTPLTNNDNSKYVNQLGPPRRPGPPTAPAKENVIQVMTAERREYSRPGGPPFGDQYFEPDSYNYGYEPTQDSQWMNDNAGWAPTGIKELTPGPPQMLPLPMGGMGPPPPHMVIRPPMPIPNMVPMPPPHMAGMNMMPPARVMPNNPTERDNRERERERPDRERDRERERERERERDRERDWPARDERERERREREHDRHRDRGKSEETERPAGNESPTRERERRRRERERDRERTKRERSHSRERSSRRRSRSRDKDRDRKSRDKKKHRKDKEDSE